MKRKLKHEKRVQRTWQNCNDLTHLIFPASRSPLNVVASLEHVFPYIKGEQITGDCSLSNIRSQSFERLFKSKSYERLLILEQRASPGNPRNNGGRDNSMRNHVFDHPDHHAETDENPELCDDIDEV